MIRYVPSTVHGRTCMIAALTAAQLDRACGCKLAAVNTRSLGIAMAVAAMNGGGLMNSYSRAKSQMFRAWHKITMIDPLPRQDEADGKVHLGSPSSTRGRNIQLGIDRSGDTFRTFHEVRDEQYRHLDDCGEAAFLAGYFRPVVDMSTHEAVTTGSKRGKHPKTRADKFGRQRIRSSFSAASSPPSMQRDGAASSPRARPAGEASVSLASPAHSSRAAAASWPQRLPVAFDMNAANSPRSRPDNGLDCGSSSGNLYGPG